MAIVKVKCSKDLIMEDGEQSFTKGMIYEGETNHPDGHLMYLNVIDDCLCKHQLGAWYKHFKKVK